MFPGAQSVLGFCDNGHACHGSSHNDAHAVRGNRVLFYAAISQCFLTGGVTVLHKQIHLAALLFCHKIIWIKILYLGGDLYW